MRQRRLMLPPFHGERMKAYGETMRAVAERHVAAWPHGTPFAAAPSMQAITLEIILRTVFGLDDEERIERVGAPLRRLLDATASQLRLLALQVTSSKNPRPRSPWGRFNQLVAAADRGRLRGDPRPPRPGRRRRPRRHPLDAAGGPRRGRPAAHRPRAARRADDPAAGRARDDGDGAELDPGAAGPPPGRGRAPAAPSGAGETTPLLIWRRRSRRRCACARSSPRSAAT